MFDEKTKEAWQGVTPSPGLKEKALTQVPAKKVTPFPANLLKMTAAVAACLILAVNVLGLGQSLVDANGQPVIQTVTLQNAAAFSRDIMPLSPEAGITVELTADADTILDVSAGTLSDAGGVTTWTVDGPGEYMLRAIKGNKVQYFVLSWDQDTGLWTIRPES